MPPARLVLALATAALLGAGAVVAVGMVTDAPTQPAVPAIVVDPDTVAEPVRTTPRRSRDDERKRPRRRTGSPATDERPGDRGFEPPPSARRVPATAPPTRTTPRPQPRPRPAPQQQPDPPPAAPVAPAPPSDDDDDDDADDDGASADDNGDDDGDDGDDDGDDG